MADPEECRVFVGGLSWDTTDKRLEQAFRRFGKVLDAKVMLERDTGRPRGFGFVTFGDEQSMEDAIAGLHNEELDGRIISVNKAQPKMMGPGGDRDYGFDPPYENGSGPRGGGPPPPRGGGGNDNCFRCGKPGHWARECPYGDGGRDRGRYPPPPPPPRYGGGGGGGGSRYDRYGGPPPSGSRYGPDYRDRSGPPPRYGDSGYDRGGRGGYSRGPDRYGSGGPARYDRGFRDRPAPYGRPSGRSSYDDRY